jgi:hypothetical protein
MAAFLGQAHAIPESICPAERQEAQKKKTKRFYISLHYKQAVAPFQIPTTCLGEAE